MESLGLLKDIEPKDRKRVLLGESHHNVPDFELVYGAIFLDDCTF